MGRELIQITDDTSIYLVHIRKALFFEIRRSFLASHSSGAIEDKRFLFLLCQYFWSYFRKFPKTFDGQLDCIFEMANIKLIIISGINNSKFFPFIIPSFQLFGRKMFSRVFYIDLFAKNTYLLPNSDNELMIRIL